MGADVGEGVEVGGPAGVSLNGMKVRLPSALTDEIADRNFQRRPSARPWDRTPPAAVAYSSRYPRRTRGRTAARGSHYVRGTVLRYLYLAAPRHAIHGASSSPRGKWQRASSPCGKWQRVSSPRGKWQRAGRAGHLPHEVVTVLS